MKLFTIPATADFLETLARGWLEESGGDPERVADGMILLPTRRAVRALTEAFLRLAGRTLLLPRILAIGALDEDPAGFTGGSAIPPAVSPFVRLAELTRLILAMEGAHGVPESADKAWPLAVELVRLLDEAHLEEVDLPSGLATLARSGIAAEFPEHWQKTQDFLSLITGRWPEWLERRGLLDRAARLVALLDRQAELWQSDPPASPVWGAGSPGGIPAVARLLGVIAGLPRGRVILPGFDPGLDASTPLPPTHPQAKTYRLLGQLGVPAERVEPWPGPLAQRAAPARERLLRTAFLPAPALTRWPEEEIETGALAGLFRLETADEQEEAEAIALILRQALDAPGIRAALITPDRGLAERVRSELLRYDVVIDDSAGEPLLATPPAVFLRLLAEAVMSDFAPIPLLALLKHPLTGLGLPPAETRRRARALERLLRCDPLPRQTRLHDLERFIARRAGGTEEEEEDKKAFIDLLGRLERAVRPLRALGRSAVHPGAAGEGPGARHPPRALLEALIEAGESVAADDREGGENRLWAYEEGGALARLLSEALPALDGLPAQAFSTLRGLFEAVVGDTVVRTRRSQRGRMAGEHPRLVIWGVLEARLQSADLVVLGGLVEGVWPAEADPGPWLSRPLRERLGLPSPDAVIGDAAHDFFLAAAAAPTVILSAPARRNRAPAVPSRWLARLEALTRGRLPRHPASLWVRTLDRPRSPPRPAPRPAPNPPREVRPARLSVSAVALWRANPYALYAQHILKLAPLTPLHYESGAAEFGDFVHRALACWAKSDDPAACRQQRVQNFLNVIERLRLEEDLHPALTAWWRPRFRRVIESFLAWEKKKEPPAACAFERKGEWEMPPPFRFRLVARAHRIERKADGTLVLIDYKTGQIENAKNVAAGESPQLALESLMARGGGFGPEFSGEVGEILYLRLMAKESSAAKPHEPYETTGVRGEALAKLLEETQAWLKDLVRGFLLDPSPRPYTAYATREGGDYHLLARTDEWRGG